MAILWTNIERVSVEAPSFTNIQCFAGSDSWNYELPSFWYAWEKVVVLFTS